MKIYRECNLTSFEPWSGAVDRYKVFTYEQLEELEPILEDMNPDGMSETELNDLFWFEEDYLAQLLGFSDFEEMERRNKQKEEE